MDLTEIEIDFEQRYHKTLFNKRIKEAFRSFGADTFLQNIGFPEDLGIEILVQLELHKTTTIDVLVGILHVHCGDKGSPEAAQNCANAISYGISKGLCRFDTSTYKISPAFTLPAEIREEIDKYQFPLPMVVEPKKLTCNSDSGYLTIKGSLILKDNHHEDDICLDHLNRVNSVPLSINMETVRMVRNSWRNLDKKKDDESAEDYQKRVKAFEKYDRTSRDVIDTLALIGAEKVYLTHKYDKRGRSYAQGYHVNTQGNDWNKSVVELANKELCEQDSDHQSTQ